MLKAHMVRGKNKHIVL